MKASKELHAAAVAAMAFQCICKEREIPEDVAQDVLQRAYQLGVRALGDDSEALKPYGLALGVVQAIIDDTEKAANMLRQ